MEGRYKLLDLGIGWSRIQRYCIRVINPKKASRFLGAFFEPGLIMVLDFFQRSKYIKAICAAHISRSDDDWS